MPRNKKNQIPEGWKDYNCIGKQVANTRFLPFKVPLNEDLSRRHLNNDEWFTTDMLLKNAPNVRLIIDFTYTDEDRYYRASDITQHGIEVVKLKCPGGTGRLPPRYLLTKFYNIVDEFIYNESYDSLIGIHCTHGLNRTGYFICKYMTEKMGINGQQAIDSFELARGYPIARPTYTYDILNNCIRQ